MAEPLQQRVNERKIYEDLVHVIVNTVYKEYGDDEPARLRIYAMIADNFDGMVRALSSSTSVSLTELESNEVEDE